MATLQADSIANAAGTAGPTFPKGVDKSTAVTVTTGDLTVATADGIETVICTGTGTQTITLPSVSANAGRPLTILKTASGGSVVVTRAGSDTIDGFTTHTLGAQFERLSIVSNGVATWGGVNKVANSMVRLHTSNGYGSSNTNIRRFLTQISAVGTGITYADSATLGNLFTINENGLYAISYNDAFSAGASLGVSLNSSQLTADIKAITAADALIFANTSAADTPAGIAWTGRLVAGDLIRAHGGSTTDSSAPSRVRFTITQLARF